MTMNESKDRLSQAAKQVQQTPELPETEIWQGGYSAKAMLGSWLAGVFVSAGLIVALFTVDAIRDNTIAWRTGWILIAAIWIGLIGMFAYRKLAHHYLVTTQRLKHRDGILFRTMNRIELIDIDDVVYHQGPIQLLLKVGNITIKSSDVSHPVLVLRGIANVKEIADKIDDARRVERRRRGLHIETV